MHAVVAVTCDRSPGVKPEGMNEHGRIRPTLPTVHVGEAVLSALRDAEVEPILLPPSPVDIDDMVDWVMDRCGGVVITGGGFDIHPSHYGQAVTGRLDRVDPGRTDLELALARACIERDIPVLGICGGMQVLAVAAGGSLIQDIKTGIPEALEHEQTTDPAKTWHPVSLSTCLIRKAYGVGMIRVNSTHHQAVADPGALEIVGRAPDGVVEAVEHPDLKCCAGVQWHPELIDTAPFRMLAYFAARKR